MKPAASARMILAACLLAAVLGGCGLGPGETEGSADLLITKDYGNTELASKKVDGLTESTTVMRALDSNARKSRPATAAASCPP